MLPYLVSKKACYGVGSVWRKSVSFGSIICRGLLTTKRKTTQLKEMLKSSEIEFIMEAHSGLSAKIVEETGIQITYIKITIDWLRNILLQKY